ncbi:hypothetical protein ATANTOWER_016627 [Ataeniobius toweri]|uniref:Uncharacterized protein n=1 Tax=Ataeniobius toweri TaxID=208326 RepID=A0ABU7A826_9TELE|nr:hypothetical protein [Ataeniobius toweri]
MYVSANCDHPKLRKSGPTRRWITKTDLHVDQQLPVWSQSEGQIGSTYIFGPQPQQLISTGLCVESPALHPLHLQEDISTLIISRDCVERAADFCLMGVHIEEDLSWSIQHL